MRLYGKVWLSEYFWVIETEPQVSLRIKRVFQKVHKADFGKITLAATPENSRELEWFLERYPMEVEDPEKLHELADEHRRIENVVANIVNRDNYEPAEFDMALPAREYQRVAADLAMQTGRLLVADDVGLGKSCTAICTLTDPDNLPALIVTLTHLPKQWQNEIGKFAPGLRTHIVKKGTPYDMTKGPRGRRDLFPDVIIINYHKLAGWAESLAGVVKSVIFDEAQELRRSVSLKYAAAIHLTAAAKLKVGLSATPIYNYGGEIFNVISALSPGSLGSQDEFMREWCYGGIHAGDRPKIREPKAFGSYLRENGLMLRRTRKEVGRELEDLTKVPHAVEANTAALDSIEDSAAELAKIILAQGAQGKGLKMRASEQLSNILRQATGIAKAAYVADFVRILVESGEPVVLYGWHREVYKIWQAKLKDLNPAMYTGTESPTQKAASRDAFLLGETDILIMSLRSGAGLDGLQARCRTVVFGELDWSPGVHDQCLSMDTEVLTISGFCREDEVKEGDLVCGFNVADGSMHWVPVQKKVVRPAGEEPMYEISGKRIDVRVTAGHRMVTSSLRRTTTGRVYSKWFIQDAKDLAGTARRYIPISGVQDAPGADLSIDECRLIGLFLSDGARTGRNRHSLNIYQAAHQPWNEQIVRTLDACNLRWTRYERTTRGTRLFTYYIPKTRTGSLWSKDEIDILSEGVAAGRSDRNIAMFLPYRSEIAVGKKRRSLASGIETRIHEGPGEPSRTGFFHLERFLDTKKLHPDLEEMTTDQLLAVLDGLFIGDGNKESEKFEKKDTRCITSTNKPLLDSLQSLCVRRGIYARISSGRTNKTSFECANPKTVYRFYYEPNTLRAVIPHRKNHRLRKVDSIPGEIVWCLSNRLQTLVVRRNGKVSVVGNCSGRVHRDGQEHPVMAYFLLADTGSDPIIADVLGVKRAQMQGIRDPNADLIERSHAGDGNARKLAEAYLKQRGIKPTEPKMAKVIQFPTMANDDTKTEEETPTQT